MFPPYHTTTTRLQPLSPSWNVTHILSLSLSTFSSCPTAKITHREKKMKKKQHVTWGSSEKLSAVHKPNAKKSLKVFLIPQMKGMWERMIKGEEGNRLPICFTADLAVHLNHFSLNLCISSSSNIHRMKMFFKSELGAVCFLAPKPWPGWCVHATNLRFSWG